MTWEWVVYAFGAAVVVYIVVMAVRHYQDDDGDGLSLTVVPVPGLGTVKYHPNELTRSQAEGLALRMRKIKDRVWPRLQRIYGRSATYHLNYIRFDKRYTHDGKAAVVKLFPGAGIMHLRPQGGLDHTAEFWFALELNNLYLVMTYGRGSDGQPRRPDDELLYDEAVRMCIAVAAGNAPPV